jgi:hypothetical protein
MCNLAKSKYLMNFFLLYFFITFSTSAHAYLDPGSGGFIIQAILAFIAAAITSLSFYWSKFKDLIKKTFKKKDIKKSKDG